MTIDASTVLRDGLALSESDRAAVASQLIASLGSPGSESTEADTRRYATEVQRRVDRALRQESHGVALDQALTEVRARLADL